MSARPSSRQSWPRAARSRSSLIAGNVPRSTPPHSILRTVAPLRRKRRTGSSSRSMVIWTRTAVSRARRPRSRTSAARSRRCATRPPSSPRGATARAPSRCCSRPSPSRHQTSQRIAASPRHSRTRATSRAPSVSTSASWTTRSRRRTRGARGSSSRTVAKRSAIFPACAAHGRGAADHRAVRVRAAATRCEAARAARAPHGTAGIATRRLRHTATGCGGATHSEGDAAGAADVP
jgi:hypothetical protein